MKSQLPVFMLAVLEAILSNHDGDLSTHARICAGSRHAPKREKIRVRNTITMQRFNRFRLQILSIRFRLALLKSISSLTVVTATILFLFAEISISKPIYKIGADFSQ